MIGAMIGWFLGSLVGWLVSGWFERRYKSKLNEKENEKVTTSLMVCDTTVDQLVRVLGGTLTRLNIYYYRSSKKWTVQFGVCLLPNVEDKFAPPKHDIDIRVEGNTIEGAIKQARIELKTVLAKLKENTLNEL